MKREAFRLKRYFLFVSISFLAILPYHGHAQNFAVNFDGIDDYIGINAPIASNASYTKEAWVYAINASTPNNIISSQNAPFWLNGGLLRAGQAAQYEYVVDPTSFPLNRWVHVAVTYDAPSQTMNLYKDGKLVDFQTSVPAYTGESINIGAHNPGTSTFQGIIDEVRIWNVARTAEEIKRGMYNDVATNSAGLIAYYRMNDGTGTTLTNSTATAGFDGTLANGPTWVASPVQYGSNAVSLDGIDDYIELPLETVNNLSAGTIEVWVNLSSLDAEPIMVKQSDGENTYAALTIGYLPSSGGVPIAGDAGRVYFHSSNGIASLSSTSTLTTGTWYHIAVTFNTTGATMYIDGNAESTASGNFQIPDDLTVTNFRLGNWTTSNDFFNGQLDELRVWNTVRTQAEIQAYKDVTITGTEAGLVALFSFDQGISNGTNTGLTLAIDQTSNNNDGTLTNMAMTGTTSNWTDHPMTILPVKLTDFTALADAVRGRVRLQWKTATEQNSRQFIIERSANGFYFYSIGAIPAAGNTNFSKSYSFIDRNPLSGNSYYRLKAVNEDGKFEYSTVRSIHLPVSDKLIWYTQGKGTVKIRLQNGGNEHYRLSDMSGRIIKQGALTNGNTQISGLPPGAYHILVETSSGRKTGLIICQ